MQDLRKQHETDGSRVICLGVCVIICVYRLKSRVSAASLKCGCPNVGIMMAIPIPEVKVSIAKMRAYAVS